MKISKRSINALGNIITGDISVGDKKITRYRSGGALVRFFNEFGTDDTYGQGFPSRWKYAEDCLTRFNNTDQLAAIILSVLDPREFIGTTFDRAAAISYLNEYIKYDGYEIIIDGEKCKIRDLKNITIKVKQPFNDMRESHSFIEEQIKKSELKIDSGDYDGAITNARSLLEAVLIDIEQELSKEVARYDGDLLKLYRRVQKLLNLEPERKDISDTLKQILGGLVSIVGGIASLRNKMSDAHVRSYRPDKHHAILAVNAVKTLVNFLFDTKQYQKK